MYEDIDQKIKKLCCYVCNGKTYRYEQSLYKAAKYGLYDAGIIYVWNIFMLFLYEKMWQLRIIDEIEGVQFKTDKILIGVLAPGKPDDYFNGHLCAINKIQTECKQGEDAIVGRMKEVFKDVDQQYFKKAQSVLQKRNEKAHVNSVNCDESELIYSLDELIKTCSAIQDSYKTTIQKIFDNLEKDKDWLLSENDTREIDNFFSSQPNVDVMKYIFIVKLITRQEFAPDAIKNIKNKSVEYFLNSNSFSNASKNASFLIKPLATTSFLTDDDIKNILKKSFDNNAPGYNQILQSNGIDDIFIELYNLSQNNFPELDKDWGDFVQKIKNGGYQSNFIHLIEIHDSQ